MRAGVYSPAFVLGLLVAFTVPLAARDLGTEGAVFEITEPDLGEVLLNRLNEFEANGELDALREEAQDTTRAYAARPRPAIHLHPIDETRGRFFDPSITVYEDILSADGTVIVAKGTVVNPLDVSGFNKTILYVDGDSAGQVAWANAHGDELTTTIVMFRGNPVEVSDRHGRRIWFDQDAQIATRFGLTATPARIERFGRQLAITEVGREEWEAWE
jgi:conjugal transfer pilus assembly protein TraW